MHYIFKYEKQLLAIGFILAFYGIFSGTTGFALPYAGVVSLAGVFVVIVVMLAFPYSEKHARVENEKRRPIVIKRSGALEAYKPVQFSKRATSLPTFVKDVLPQNVSRLHNKKTFIKKEVSPAPPTPLISNNIPFDIHLPSVKDIHILRAGYSVQKVIGGVAWKASSSEELSEFVKTSDLVILVTNSKTKPDAAFTRALEASHFASSPPMVLDVGTEYKNELVSILNYEKPKIVFLSCYPTSKEDVDLFCASTIMNDILEAFPSKTT
jgi:hypothetical protein